jgi:benzoyl-CoA reductase/2-hydroxyglutaryl-CoA dehydratase subunit BcrC/BadD/HgdB
LRDELRKLCGRAVTDEALCTAIASGNENRAACRELLKLRNSQRLLGSTALCAIGARFAMRIDDHTRLMEASASLPSNQRQAGARVLVAGNAQDNILLYQYLESQDLAVVADHQWLGDNCCVRDVASTNDPLGALTEHYHKYSLTSRRFPQSCDELVGLAKASTADGVIFFLFASEEALSWDVPDQSRALEAAGIPTLILDGQPYAPRIDADFEGRLAEFKSRVCR